MDFERAYQNFLDGTATQEEIDFVREEMAKAREINNILDNVNYSDKAVKAEIVKAEQEEVKKAVKKFNIKNTIKIFIIAMVSLVIVTGGILAAIFIPAYNNANENINISKNEAIQMAKEYVINNDNNVIVEQVEVLEYEREFEYNGSAKRAHYVYVIEVYDGVDNVYEIEINAKTGKLIVERD